MGRKIRSRSRSTADTEKQDGFRPRVWFAVGDADFGYTEGKIWRLAQRLKQQTGWEITGLTHDRETFESAVKLGLQARLLPIESPGVTVAERLRSTDEMIRETADVTIPGSELLLWKVLAMDDFLGSLQLFGATPTSPLEDADAVVVPLMAVDNNTRNTCGLYTWVTSEARRKNIPVVGLEVSPLGNKNTLSHLPADHYAVKNRWSKEFLVSEGIAPAEQISVLKWEESYFLWPGLEDYAEAYLERDAKAREMLNIAQDEFVVLIPHHVAFIWETRKILESLAQVKFPLHVVIRVDPRTMRRHFPEREIVLQSYGKEIRDLHHVVIDERIGVGLLLQYADLVIAAFSGTTTERASFCRKPTIICQAMGQAGWRGEMLYWEPRPEKIAALVQSWKEHGWLPQERLALMIQRLRHKARDAANGVEGQIAEREIAIGDNGPPSFTDHSL